LEWCENEDMQKKKKIEKRNSEMNLSSPHQHQITHLI